MKFEHVPFEQAKLCHLVGETPDMTYTQLREVFGRSEDDGVDDKAITTRWCLKFEDGTIATIYDNCATDRWDPDLPDLNTFLKSEYSWYIGGENENAAKRVFETIAEHERAKNPQSEESKPSSDGESDESMLDALAKSNPHHEEDAKFADALKRETFEFVKGKLETHFGETAEGDKFTKPFFRVLPYVALMYANLGAKSLVAWIIESSRGKGDFKGISASKLVHYEHAVKGFLKEYLMDGLRDFIGKGMSHGMSMADMGMADMEENVQVIKLPAVLEPLIKDLIAKGVSEDLLGRMFEGFTKKAGDHPSA